MTSNPTPMRVITLQFRRFAASDSVIGVSLVMTAAASAISSSNSPCTLSGTSSNSGAGQQFAFDREIGIMWIQKVDTLSFHDRWVEIQVTLQAARTQNAEVLIFNQAETGLKCRSSYVSAKLER